MKKGIFFLLVLMFIVSWTYADGIKPEHGPTILVQQAEIGGRAVGDDCTDPIVISIPADLPYSDLAQTTCGRGNSYSTTCLGSYDGGEDIIYRLDVTADTFIDLTFDPGTTTYTGILVADGCPDVGTCLDFSTNYAAVVQTLNGLQLFAGYSYYIMADTWPTPNCITAFDLTIVEGTQVFPPDNDTCATAEVTGDVTDLPFDTSLATVSGFGYVNLSPDIWYVFTAPGDGLLYVGLCGSSFDTKLALYDDCVPTTTLGTNDDSCSAQSELFDIPVVSGEDYYIQVGGYGTASGAGLLDVAFTPNPTAYPLPFAEGFEGGVLPTGWTQEYVVGAIDWTYMNGSTYAYPAAAHTGSFNAYFYNTSDNMTKLVSPQLDMGTAAEVNLTFWHTQANWAGDQDELRVYYKDSAAGTWTLLAEYITDTPAWTEETIALPNLSGDYYVAFEGLGSYGYGVCLDDVTVEELIPATPLPFADDFTAGLGNWTALGMNPGNWSQSATANAGGVAPEVKFAWTPSFTGASYFTSPTLATTGMTALDLEYKHYVNNYSTGYSVGVATTSDGGTTWNVASEIFPTVSIGPETVNLTINTPDVGTDTFQFAFFFNGPSFNINYWYIDDVTIGEAVPQAPSVLFSEYIEGSSNNKALEIWNNSGDVIDLADFRIAQSVNGGGWAYWHIFPTGATLADQDVWVMLNSATDPLLFDPLNADEVLAYPSVVHHNGDDARGLEWTPDGGTTWMLIDVIGVPTEDPGTGWDVAGVTEATANHTLYRKDSIMCGNTDWLLEAGTNADDSEWIVYDVDTFTYLGQHPAASPFAAPENVMADPSTVLVTWDAPAVVIAEDCFDTYTSGDYLGIANPALWTTWSNLPGGSEDGIISDAVSSSPSNSVLVQTNNDIIMIMDDYTSGVYSYELEMYVPTGYGGYYNLQKSSTPGVEWGFELLLNDDGTAVANAGGNATLNFTYAHDTWMNMKLVIDLDTDWCDFYVDDVFMIGYQWTLGTGGGTLLSLGGVDIFGGGCTGTPYFYFDNVVFKQLFSAPVDALIGYNVYLDGTMVGTTAATEYQLDTGTLVVGNSYTAGVSAVYDDPGESAIIEDTFTYAPAVPGDTCGDAIVVGEVTDLPFDTTTATASGFGTYISSQDLFYVYTATGDGLLYVGLCGSSFDTKLALYGSCDPTSVIATNDDSCGLQSELIDIAVFSGEDYYIQVGGYGTAAGAGLLDVGFTSSAVFDPPTNLFVDDLGYATWDAPGGATPMGLYAQWDFPSAEGGITAQDFETAYDAYDAEGADEFAVPTGETWDITEVAVLGSYGATSTGPCNLANIRIYADNAGMPGTMLFEYLDVAANPDVDGNLDCIIPSTSLAAGTYWLSVQGRQDFATAGQWFWDRQAAPTIGSEFYWQNPGDGFASGFTTWTTGSLQWPGQNDYNLSFALFGAQTDANGKTYVRTNPNQNTSEQMLVKANVERNQLRAPVTTGMAYSGALSRTLVGYNVWLDGVWVDMIFDTFYQYTGLTANTTYLAEVTAIYDDPMGESVPVDYEFMYQPTPTLDPPTDLFVDDLGYATWTAPGGGGGGLYWNDFEADDGGLISNNAAGWQWGAPTTGPMAGYSGANVWGTVLAGLYPTNSNFTLDTPTSYTIGSADAMLSFWHWYDIEASYDGGNVKISTNGGTTWDVITPLTGYTGTANTSNPLSGQPIFCGHAQGFWELAEFDLSAYAGMDVMFRWHFGSDSSVQYAGWYIDDVLLTDGGTDVVTKLDAKDMNAKITRANAVSSENSRDMNAKVTRATSVSSDESRELQGYNVYLDGTFEAYTTDTFYQHDTSGLTSGDDYTTAVEAVYDEGVSTQIDYTWTYNGGGVVFDPPQNVFVDDESALMTWTPPANTISSDDFDSYTVGGYVAQQSTQWTTWSNAPGTGEDAHVSDTYSSSPSNSMMVELNNDMVYIMEDYTSGVYSMALQMYVPTGYCGYFNMQKTTTPGQEWAFQIYFLTDGTTIIDAGAANAATFNYLHDEWMDLRLVIDLDTDWADFYYNTTHIIGYQWTLGTFGTTGLLQLGGMNIFGGANSGTTDTPLFYVDNVVFNEIVPATDALTGYNVWLDDAFITYTTDEFYQYTGLVEGTEYTAGVSAVYDDPGESVIEPYVFVYNPMTNFYPPTNLSATVEDYNNVQLAWEPPGGSPVALWDQMGFPGADGGISAQDFEASYDTYDAEGADDFVVPAGETWTLIEVDVLGSYSAAGPCDLANVRIYANNDGIPGTMLYEYLDVPATPSVEGNLFCPIPDTQLSAGTYWMSVQGRMDYATGGQWYWSRQSPPTIGYEFQWQNPNGGFGGLTSWGAGSIQWPGQTCYDLSFVIYGIASDDGVTTVYAPPERGLENIVNTKAVKNVSRSVVSRTPTISTVEVGHVSGNQSGNSRSLSGYKVYRDGAMIHEITDPLIMTYLDDDGLAAGTYAYHVTAIYTNPDGESIASNVEDVVITLPAPTNFNAVSNWPNILCTWTAMPGVDGYNLYKDGTLVTTTTSTFYLHSNVAAGTYLYKVAAVFNGGWEGPFSNVVTVLHYPDGVDPNLIPLVTSLDGNYPNPFNPTTTIKFGLHEDLEVVINVYNIKGEKVRTLVNGELEAGYHSILWNGKDDSGKNTASGVYFYKMKAGKFVSTKKMILMK